MTSKRSNELDNWRLIESQLHKLFVHDFKNPISALSANLSYLGSAMVGESEDVRGAISDSTLAADMLLKFAENLNLIAALEIAEPCATIEIGLESFVRAAVRKLERFGVSADVPIQLEEPLADAPLQLPLRYADAIIDNLILSGLRHSPQGSKVLVSTRREGAHAVIAVCDRGRPLAEPLKAGLFTREGQCEAKKNSESRYGRGLGLYVAGLATAAIGAALRIGRREDMTEFALLIPFK